ncbi:MAG: RluA family pseudouridine synthase [Thermomicrobiales bacterium]
MNGDPRELETEQEADWDDTDDLFADGVEVEYVVDDQSVYELRPTVEDKNERLDVFIASALTEYSRGFIQKLIEDGHVLVDGVQRKAKFKVTPGQIVALTIPPPEVEEFIPEAIPLEIVYEDRDVMVIDKPAGLVVHPAPGHPRGTLVNAVVHHAPDVALAGSNRPGIIHRLDKDTSGLIAVVKSDRGRAALVPQWENRTVQKGYITLVRGVIEPDEATIDAPIGRDPVMRQRMAAVRTGRPAVSHFKVLERFKDATLLEVDIETGRTHQIRVHMAFIGHPVIGDMIYGRYDSVQGVPVFRQFLHAARLSFTLPDGERKHFTSPLPRDLQTVLDLLGDGGA